MIIKNSEINIRFPRVDNIKKQYILNEEILKDKFNEANILPIPDDAPTEIPRILISSIGEHSHMNIAPEAVNLQTIYTDEFNENWELCEQYINSRIEDVFKLTDKFTMDRYNYIGIVTNLVWDDIQKDGNKKLFQNLFGKEAIDNLDDLMVRYTYVEKEKYFVNITLQSAKIYNNSNGEESGSFSDENLEAHTVAITMDINDRYLFNKQKGYTSNKESFKDIMALTTDIINSKLRSLVEEGEY